MKALIKKFIAYDKLYPIIHSSALYHIIKKAHAQLTSYLYGNPAKDFFIIGITGTNGKTTTVNLLHKILNDNLAPTVAVSTACLRI